VPEIFSIPARLSLVVPVAGLPTEGLREGLGEPAVAWAGLGEVTALQDFPEGRGVTSRQPPRRLSEPTGRSFLIQGHSERMTIMNCEL
jgi:hypothetical protein